jgi:uncharacterized protein YbjT (DUF2867 family)
MRPTIFGATGRTGAELVEQALGRGHLVTVTSSRRPPAIRAASTFAIRR